MVPHSSQSVKQQASYYWKCKLLEITVLLKVKIWTILTAVMSVAFDWIWFANHVKIYGI